MTLAMGNLEILPGERLYEPIRQLLTLNACVGIAFITVATQRVPNLNDSFYPSKNFGVTVVVPSRGPMELAIADEKPDQIVLTFLPTVARPQEYPFENGQSRSLFPVLTMLSALVFSNYFEAHKGWIHATFSKEVSKWPDILNFARAIRNFASHSGKVYFEKSTNLPVRWRTLGYSFADNGREVIGPEIQFPDLVLLMIDVAKELDGHGAPIPN
jgi:hypothetical protein